MFCCGAIFWFCIATATYKALNNFKIYFYSLTSTYMCVYKCVFWDHKLFFMSFFLFPSQQPRSSEFRAKRVPGEQQRACVSSNHLQSVTSTALQRESHPTCSELAFRPCREAGDNDYNLLWFGNELHYPGHRSESVPFWVPFFFPSHLIFCSIVFRNTV